MIKDVEYWREWEDRYIASRPIDVARNFRVAEALYEAARVLAPKSDPAVDLETRLAHKLRVIRAFHAASASRKARAGA